jgi:hypothetical protein
MPQLTREIFRKAVLDAGIGGKDWRKIDAFEEFTTFFNTTYAEDLRQSMKYDAVLKIAKEWWGQHQSRYS